MNVNATLNGVAVRIIGVTTEHYRALITYIDTQSGAGNLRVAEVNLTDLPQLLGTSAEVYTVPVEEAESIPVHTSQAVLDNTVYGTAFATITDYTEYDPEGMAAPGPNGYNHGVHAADFASVEDTYTLDGMFDISCRVYIRSIPANISNDSYAGMELDGANHWMQIRGDGAGGMEYFVGNVAGNWDPPLTFGSGTIEAGDVCALRMKRDASDFITVYVWNKNSGMWEWDGDIEGVTSNQAKAAATYKAALSWQDVGVTGTGNYSDGIILEYAQAAGTRNSP